MNNGYGQMDVHGNLNLRDHSSGYLAYIKKNIKHRWNIFETSRGKGEHNGAGACVK